MEAKTAQTKRNIEQYDTLYLQGAMSKEEHEAAVSQAKKKNSYTTDFYG